MAISEKLMEVLACPVCLVEVRLTEDKDGLKCVKCHRVYPIREKIPIMMKEEARIEEK